jgi:hypothetical protein
VNASFFVEAQTSLPKNDLDDKYTPNASSMFNNLVKKAYDENSYVEIEFKNAVKFWPIMLAREKAFFTYERTVVKGLVGVAGIGKGFGQDVFQKVYFAIGDPENGSAMTINQALNNSSYLGSTPLLHLGAKLYFTGTAFEDGFVEFNYRHERVDLLLPTIVNGTNIDGENDVRMKMNGFSVGLGFTSVSGEKSNFVNEFYINLGFKSFNFTQYDLVSVQNPISGKNELFFRKASDTYSNARILPSFNVGYALGFGW